MKEVLIIVAENVSDSTYNYICDALKFKFGQEFTYRRVVDSNMIGGFKFFIDGNFYDLSISSQLELLKKHVSE